MRQPRFTYPEAFHHSLNARHGGEVIMAGEECKKAFLEILERGGIDVQGDQRIRHIRQPQFASLRQLYGNARRARTGNCDFSFYTVRP